MSQLHKNTDLACPKCDQPINKHIILEMVVNILKTKSQLKYHVDTGDGVALVCFPDLLLSNKGFTGGSLRISATWDPSATVTSLEAHRAEMSDVGMNNAGDCCVINGVDYLHEVEPVTAGERISIGINFKTCPGACNSLIDNKNVIGGRKSRTGGRARLEEPPKKRRAPLQHVPTLCACGLGTCTNPVYPPDIHCDFCGPTPTCAHVCECHDDCAGFYCGVDM